MLGESGGEKIPHRSGRLREPAVAEENSVALVSSGSGISSRMSGMKPVDLYARVRYACHVEGLSQRETARRFGIDTKTVRKMLTFAVLPPGYRRSKPPARPKLDPFTPIIAFWRRTA